VVERRCRALLCEAADLSRDLCEASDVGYDERTFVATQKALLDQPR